MPFTVGATAGGVVYPRSPFSVVPEAVFVYVLERIVNVSAIPKPGEVAAKVGVLTIERTTIERIALFDTMFHQLFH